MVSLGFSDGLVRAPFGTHSAQPGAYQGPEKVHPERGGLLRGCCRSFSGLLLAFREAIFGASLRLSASVDS